MNQPSEYVIVAGKINPANANNSTVDSDYVDMSKFHDLLASVQLCAVDNTVDFKLRQSRDTGGTGEQDLSGKAITHFVGTDDGKIALINLKAEELTQTPAGAPYRFVRARATVGNGTTNLISCVVLGVKPRFG